MADNEDDDKTMPVTPEQAKFAAELLKFHFPWIGATEDPGIHCGDQCNEMEYLHELLTNIVTADAPGEIPAGTF